MNAGASTSAVPSPIEGSGTAWVLLGSWALSPARPTPIHPRHECRGFSALLVKQATSTIPIVMLYADDPVADGIVAGLAQPGGNITGVGGFVSELSGKRLELLTEAVPEVTHIAVLVQPRNPMAAVMIQDIERVARRLGVQLHVVEVWQLGGFERAF